jgi:nicotinate-nucleotide adenylyltransferase
MSESKGIGIFGGTFNPIHWGHINSIKTVKEKIPLESLFVVPAYLSPGRSRVEGPTPMQRLEIVQAAFSEGFPGVEVDDFEIEQEGWSYTIRTLRQYQQRYIGKDLYLIIGMDQFEYFDHWKDFEQILEMAHLVVTSRPGLNLPQDLEEFPEDVVDLVTEFEGGSTAHLITGKQIQFIQLEDVEVSSTEIRKRLRSKEPAADLIPPPVEDYIKKYHLYEGLEHRIGDYEELTRYCARLLFDRKGMGVMGFDVKDLNQPSEYVLIASGTSTRHTTTLAEQVTSGVKKKYGVYPQSVEGLREGRWVVLDFGALIVHVFYDFTRHEYRLEDLWSQGRELQLKESSVESKGVEANTDN